MNNLLLNTDSYKASHWLQYPDNTTKVFSYIESRGGKYDETLFFGLQMFIKEYLTKPITMADVNEAAVFWEAHGEPFNVKGWKRLIEKYAGYLPLRIKAAPEGSIIPTGNVLVTVENTDAEFYWLTSYVETALLRAVWYPTTVATNSWSIKQIIRQFLELSGDPAGLPFKLHDFGARGVSSMESAGIGGAAHLVNFMGTDTVTGILYAQKYYNEEEMVGFSIPAAEHSTQTILGPEGEPLQQLRMVDQFGGKYPLLAVVSDSYDIYESIKRWATEFRQTVIDSGSTIVVRPDSGKPSEVVLKVLETFEEYLPEGDMTVNEKGYKVLPNFFRVIQGDGVNRESIKEILDVIVSAGFSADNVAFGMGGAMLQQLDRDTQKFAMKASAAMVDGEWVDVYKDPITDSGKRSKKGKLTLVLDDFLNYRTVREEHVGDQQEVLAIIYEDGIILNETSFNMVRERANN